MQTLNFSTSELILKENRQKFLTLYISHIKYLNWITILSTLESTSVDKAIR